MFRRAERESVAETMATVPFSQTFLGMTGPVWSMVALTTLTSVLFTLLYLFPVSGQAQAAFGTAAVVFLLVSVSGLLLRQRATTWWVYANTILWMCITVLLILASEPVEISVLLLGMVVMSVYVGYWLPWHHGLVIGFVTCCAAVAAIAVTGYLVETAVVWAAFISFAWVTWLFISVLNRYLRQTATRDPLTGLLNRTGLMIAITPLNSRGMESPVTVAVIDLDGFKEVNDTKGHLAGDATLKQVASHLLGDLRRHDIVARTGGDEFLVILPDASMEVAKVVLDRVTADFPIGFSVGMANWDTERSFNDAVAAADAAMYHHKAGKKTADRSPRRI